MKVCITKAMEMEVSHWLPDYVGACANMHGHTYKLEVTISRASFAPHDPMGDRVEDDMVVDFKVLNKVMKDRVFDMFDHQIANSKVNYRPTAERMAVDILQRVQIGLDDYGPKGTYRVERVKLYETSNSYVEVFR